MTLIDWAEWIAKLAPWLKTNPPPAEWDNAGPAPEEHPPTSTHDVVTANWGGPGQLGTAVWEAGWWNSTECKRMPAHPKRVGPAIKPQSVVVHTTDCWPGTGMVIANSWSTKAPLPGRGGAHFIVNRTASQGVVQLVPLTKNAYHAGEADHGWWVLPDKTLVNPNTCAIGIELDCAGRLDRPKTGNGDPTHRDTGRTIPRADCYYHGPSNSWWHKPTEYQFEVLGRLLDAILPALSPFPVGTKIMPRATPRHQYKANGVLWAEASPLQITGHVTLDPLQKTDPGPQVMAWINTRYGAK